MQAGNPGLKLQNDLSGSAGFQFTDVKKALSFSVRLNGSYTFNYIAQRRTLFLEDTYLPQYDYTARKGAQLTTQANVGGNYNLGGRVSYSQQINPLRSTLNVSVNYGFSQTPYFTGEDLFHSVRHSLGFGFGFDSGFSSKVKLNIRSNTSMSSYTTQKETAQELREQLTARVDLRFGKYFGSVGTLYEFYCNSRSRRIRTWQIAVFALLIVEVTVMAVALNPVYWIGTGLLVFWCVGQLFDRRPARHSVAAVVMYFLIAVMIGIFAVQELLGA